MPVTTIVPQFVNKPAEGKRASIKTSEGGYYGFKDPKYGGKVTHADFQPGVSYEVEYTTREGKGEYAGREFRDIVCIVGQKHKIATNGAQAAQATSQLAGTSRKTDPQDSDNMWACKIVGDGIAAGKVEWTEEGLARAEIMVRSAHKRAAANRPPPPRDDMDDEIPDFGGDKA